jgi:hypothetical protein
MMRPLQMSFIMMMSISRMSRMLSFIDANVDSIVVSKERASPSGVRTCIRRRIRYESGQSLLKNPFFWPYIGHKF